MNDGFEGLYTGSVVRLTESAIWDILTTGGTILGTTNSGDFRDFLLTRKLKRKPNKRTKSFGLDCIICIGGDGTMTIANTLQQCGMNVVGVPKTIDK